MLTPFIRIVFFLIEEVSAMLLDREPIDWLKLLESSYVGAVPTIGSAVGDIVEWLNAACI